MTLGKTVFGRNKKGGKEFFFSKKKLGGEDDPNMCVNPSSYIFCNFSHLKIDFKKEGAGESYSISKSGEREFS